MKGGTQKFKSLLMGLVLLLCVSFLLTGCSSEKNSELSYNFKQGSSGLELSFLPNSPPDKVYPHSNFKIVLKEENKAAYDITQGKISIIGLDSKYFTLYPQDQSFDTLVGRSVVNPAGDSKYAEFDVTSTELVQNAERYLGNYYLKASYQSTFEFTDSVCINPSTYDVYDSGCKISGPKSYSGQGAPVGVVRMEEILSPGNEVAMELRLEVRNIGTGRVKKITLGDAKLGGEELECRIKGQDEKEINLDPDKQEMMIICTKKLREKNSYTTTLYLDLGYEYELKEQHSLLMVR